MVIQRKSATKPREITSRLPVIREGRWWHISSSLLESHSPMAGYAPLNRPHLLAPATSEHSRPSQEAKGRVMPPQQRQEEEWRGITDLRRRGPEPARSYSSGSTNQRSA